MPNYCENSLTITGDGHREALAALTGVDSPTVGDRVENFLNIAFPMPEELATDDVSPPNHLSGESEDDYRARMSARSRAYGATDWYDWRVANWSTKWDTTATVEQVDDEVAVLTFATAWSPPLGWLAHTGAQFPNLTFTLAYCEQGMQVAGVVTLSGGELRSSTGYEGDWEFDDDWNPTGDLAAFLDRHNLAGAGG